MLNKKEMSDLLHEKNPTEGTGCEPAHRGLGKCPPQDRLDYGLLDDFRSGRDRFFDSRGEPESGRHECVAKCPGFANQVPGMSEPVAETRPFPVDQAIRPEDLCAATITPLQSRVSDPAPGTVLAHEPRRAAEQECTCPACAATAAAKQEPSARSIHAAGPRATAAEMPAQESSAVSSSWQPRQPAGEVGSAAEPEPVISSDDLTVAKRDSSSWSKIKDHDLVTRTGRMLSHILAVSKEFVHTRRRIVLPAGAAVLLMMTFLYLANPKPYTVETRLMFISGDGRNPDLQGWSLDKETRYFNNTNIVYALSQRLFDSQAGPSASPADRSVDNRKPANKQGKVVADGREHFKNPGEFIKWFVKASSLEVDNAAAPGRLTMKLTGKDPKFLKAVSENYVRSYVDFRRTIQPAAPAQDPNAPAVHENAAPPVLNTLNDRLQIFDIQEREYELAVNLLDSGKSPFSGFLPRDHMVDANSLGHFQQKIVQLELAKNSLKLKYAPESREVRTLEAEIQAARKGMRQCIVEQLRFVKHNKELLLTQKMELEKGLIAPSDVRPKPLQPPAAPVKQFVGTDAPVPLGNGLYLIWDYPSLTDKPLLSRVGDVKDRLVMGVQQSVDGVRDAKDSLITGLYHTLVSDDVRKTDDQVTDDQAAKGSSRYIVRQ